MNPSDRIVVGVDGSEGSNRALAWAMTEAGLRGIDVEVVHVWRYSYGLAPAGPPTMHERLHDELAADEQALLDRAVAVAAELGPGVGVSCSLREGAAAHELVRAAADAALLVVGTRGRGGFAGLLLGSVGQQCAHHASCPLVIVPAARE